MRQGSGRMSANRSAIREPSGFYGGISPVSRQFHIFINTQLHSKGPMRKWGIVISVFYALILLGLIVPAVSLFSGRHFDNWAKFFGSVCETYQVWFFWVPAGAILLSQAFPALALNWTRPGKYDSAFAEVEMILARHGKLIDGSYVYASHRKMEV
jgi:hypothetical protein